MPPMALHHKQIDNTMQSCLRMFNVTGAGTLLWAVESLFSLGDIDLNVVDHTPGNIVVPNQLSELINVTLISVEQNSEHLNLGNLSSELTILVTYTTIGKHVYCSDTSHRLNESPSIIIKGHSKLFAVNFILYYRCSYHLSSSCTITSV